jgi:hypothetical protein
MKLGKILGICSTRAAVKCNFLLMIAGGTLDEQGSSGQGISDVARSRGPRKRLIAVARIRKNQRLCMV